MTGNTSVLRTSALLAALLLSSCTEERLSSQNELTPKQGETKAVADISTPGGRTGTIEAGAECPRVRFDDGSVFSLERFPGPANRLSPGTRVRVSGQPMSEAAITRCQQGRGYIATQIDIL